MSRAVLSTCDSWSDFISFQSKDIFWTPLRSEELMTRYTKLDSPPHTCFERYLILLIYELDRIYLMTRLNSNEFFRAYRGEFTEGTKREIRDAIVDIWCLSSALFLLHTRITY